MAFENITKEELVEKMIDARAADIVTFIKILVSQVGKNKAIELIKGTRWEAWSRKGMEAAREAGNPQDMSSYIDAYWVKAMKSIPWVPPAEWDEKTESRAVTTVRSYCIGRAIAKLGDEMIKEIGEKAYCIHDIAWANGFNPNIKGTITRTFYDGDDCCQLVLEI